jgi:UTP--glucose-1-phosphate uridylyltransferase
MKNSKSRKVTKAVIAAAGYGTRFLPASKNIPKQMFPIIDKPIIHHVVEECVDSGIEEIIIITQAGHGIMEDYFDSHVELEHVLGTNGKKELLEKVKSIPNLANFVYVRQKKNLPYGNATPLLAIRNLINKGERFVYLFGDDLVLSKIPCTKQIIDYSDKKSGSVVGAAYKVPRSEVYRYGTYILQKGSKDKVVGIVEKPEPKNAPSTLVDFGRFVLNDDIIDIARSKVKTNELGIGNELWLVDMLTEYAQKNDVYALEIEGDWMTTGDPLRYMKTQVTYALEREDIGKEFKKYLRTLKL